MRNSRLRSTKLIALLGAILMIAAACDYSHDAATLTIDDKQEFIIGDEIVLGVIEYRTTPGAEGTTSVSYVGSDAQIGGDNNPEGTTLTIPTAIGEANHTDLEPTSLANLEDREFPEVVGKVIVVWENDFSSQQDVFMQDVISTFASDLQQTVELLDFADLSDEDAYAATVATALGGVFDRTEAYVAALWPTVDEGFFTDDDDLIGTGFTAYSLGSLGVDLAVENAYAAELTEPNRTGGSMYAIDANAPGQSGGPRADSIVVAGDGASYTLNFTVTNDFFDQPAD